MYTVILSVMKKMKYIENLEWEWISRYLNNTYNSCAQLVEDNRLIQSYEHWEKLDQHKNMHNNTAFSSPKYLVQLTFTNILIISISILYRAPTPSQLIV